MLHHKPNKHKVEIFVFSVFSVRLGGAAACQTGLLSTSFADSLPQGGDWVPQHPPLFTIAVLTLESKFYNSGCRRAVHWCCHYCHKVAHNMFLELASCCAYCVQQLHCTGNGGCETLMMVCSCCMSLLPSMHFNTGVAAERCTSMLCAVKKISIYCCMQK